MHVSMKKPFLISSYATSAFGPHTFCLEHAFTTSLLPQVRPVS